MSPFHSDEMLIELEMEVCHFQALGNVLICGEFNARTGTHFSNINDTMHSKYTVEDNMRRSEEEFIE